MRRDGWAGKLNWRTFWTNTFSIYDSEVRHSLILLCLPPHSPTASGCTAILVRRGTAHHSVPVSGLNHMQAPADRPVNIRKAYLSPSHLLIGAKLSIPFCRWLPHLLAGDLNAKHVDWKSRLSTRGETSYVIMLLEMAQNGRHTACQNETKKVLKQENRKAK